MSFRCRTRGFVLKKENSGEADQIFTLYTEDLGRIKVLGRGIRKLTSKLRSGIDVFNLCEIEFVQGKNFKTLTDAFLIKKHDEKAEIFADCAEDLLKWQEKDPKVWKLYLFVLSQLTRLRTSKIEILYYFYFWNLIAIMGYKPNLFNCFGCGRNFKSETNFFSAEKNAFLCPGCSEPGNIPLSCESVKIIRLAFCGRWELLKKLSIKGKYLQELDRLAERLKLIYSA